MKIKSSNTRIVLKTFLAISVFLGLLYGSTNKVGSQKESPLSCADGSRLADVVITLIDESGEFPATFRKEDLRLVVNGSATSILEMDLQVDQPLDLAILIDTSVSQEEVLPTTKLAAKGIIQAFLTPKDRAALISFSNDIEVEQSLTSDFSRVAAALDAAKVTLPPGYIGGGVVLSRGVPKGSFSGSTSLWETH